jgi:type I restriction enzyme M protein
MPRYVDTFEEESEINLGAVMQEIANLESQLTTVRAKMKNHLQKLGL